MKRILKFFIPLLLAVCIIASVGWYLLVYDREFTRDMLITQARHFDQRGNARFAATLYDLAYQYTGKSDEVAIELANQYKGDGNYTKAEYTLTNAIAQQGSVELYTALCKTYVEQDKLMDAVAMLDNIADPSLKRQLDALRPAAPVASPEPGYYNEYITVEFTASGTLYGTIDGQWPSIREDQLTDAITLAGGETTIYALSIGENGLVSPLTVLGYTVGGVIEEAKFDDPAMEKAMREAISAPEDEILMTDQLWAIREFTIPQDAKVFTDLSKLPYLEKLTITGIRMDSLSFLGSLGRLKEVTITECRFPVGDLKILAGLPFLEKLTLSECGLSTIADLGGAQSLKYLDLSGNTLRNLEPLIPMTTLEELYLQHNAVTSLDALMTLVELQKLDISYNSVTTLANLASCNGLTWLNAGNNLLQNLDGVEALTALTHLDVDHNDLESVAVLGKLTELTELNISNNRLLSIAELTSLTKLLSLNCSYNELTHLPMFPAESVLSMIDGSYNNLSTLAGLTNLEELTYVYMDYNQLTTLDHIANCYRLVMVNAYGNPDLHDVSKLTKHNIIVNYDPT